MATTINKQLIVMPRACPKNEGGVKGNFQSLVHGATKDTTQYAEAKPATPLEQDIKTNSQPQAATNGFWGFRNRA